MWWGKQSLNSDDEHTLFSQALGESEKQGHEGVQIEYFWYSISFKAASYISGWPKLYLFNPLNLPEKELKVLGA